MKNTVKYIQKPDHIHSPVWLKINTPWFKPVEINHGSEDREPEIFNKYVMEINQRRIRRIQKERLREQKTEEIKKLFYYLFEEST